TGRKGSQQSVEKVCSDPCSDTAMTPFLEIYFSVVQRKVLMPNDFPSVANAAMHELALSPERARSILLPVVQPTGGTEGTAWRVTISLGWCLSVKSCKLKGSR